MTRKGLCLALLFSSLATSAWGLSITTNSNLGTFPIGYLQTPLNASGGSGVYTWSLASGTLAPGLNIAVFPGGSQIGLLGIATTPGNYSFSLTVGDGSTSVTQAFTMRVTGLTLKDTNLPDAFPNTAFSYTFNPLNNAGAVTFTVTSPPLPTGLNLSSGGVLSGMAASAGNYNINFSIFDGVDTVFRGYQLQVFAVDLTTPGVLPNVTVGTAYSQTLAATGGSGGYTYAMTGGGLPNGLGLSGAGVVSGTITSAGTGVYSFNVTVQDSSHNSFQKTMSIDVVGPTVAQNRITLGTIDDAIVGNGYGWQIPICCGGTAPFTWSATGLPAGMSIRWGSGVTSDYIAPGWGEIWGVPSTPGNYNVTLTVTDSLGASSSLTFPFHVSVMTLAPNYNLPNGTINTPYSTTFEIVGGVAPYSVVQVPQYGNGLLPDGLTLNTASAASGYFTVLGTPVENGNFDPLFKVTDGSSNTLSRNNYFNINNVAGGININNGSNLGSVTAGFTFSFQLNACCVSNYVWSAPAGLPTGVTLSPGGQLNGSASVAPGVYSFLIKAADAAGVAAPGFRLFTLNVTPLTITTNSLPYGDLSTPYSTAFAATGGTGTLTWSVIFGNYLPPGLTLAANGTLSGTPTATGQYNFGVTVADTGGHTATRFYNVDIYSSGPPPVSFQNGPNLGTWIFGTDQIALGANGGNGTYTWSLVSGSLPPGLALRTDVPTFFASNQQAGLIGVATTPGNYNFTLTVASGSSTATQAFTMRVTELVLQDVTPPDGFVGTAFNYQFTPINNAGAVTFTVNSNSTGGTMPPGLSLSSAGVLSGTPTTPGNYEIAMNISDGVDNVYQQYELYIYALKITNAGALPSSGILPNATQYASYSSTLIASGGTGPYTFTAPNGLPGGFALSSAGVISLTSTIGPGNYGFNVTVADSASNSYSKHMALDVVGSPIAPMRITTLTWNDPVLGDRYGNVQSVCCGGTAPFTWTVTGLPPGLAYEPNSNSFNNYGSTPGGVQIYGVAKTAGTYNVQYTVTDAAGATSSLVVPLHVSVLDMQFPGGNGGNLPNGTINVAYSATFRVLGGSGPYTSTKTVDGELPDGLTVTPSTLTVSGTPLENGSNFNSPLFLFADSAGNTLTRFENISISGGTSTITINSNGFEGYNLGTTPVGAFYSTQFSACCVASYTWSVGAGSTLPAGLSLSGSGQLSGTPTTPGTYRFLIAAASSSAPSNVGVKSFVLTVTPISITTGSLPYGDVGTAYSASLAATGGTGTLTWTQTFPQGSQLPPGLTLNSNGTITGTPTSAGAFNITVLVTDSSGNIAIRGYTIDIYQSGPPPLNLPLGPNLGPYAVGPNQLLIQLQANGGTPPYHYSITPGTLPILGLRVQDGQPLPTNFPSSVTGGILALLGPGNYNTSIRVTDSTSATFDRAINFSVLPVDILSQGTVPRAVLNTAYSYQFSGYGGSGTYNWTASGLPPGLTLSSTGLLSGTPTSSGNFNFTANIADAAGGGSIGRGESITVSPFAITDTAVLPDATAGTAYSHQFVAPGCGAGCNWTAPNGNIPSGFTLTSSGLLSGTYTPAGGAEFSFFVQASGAGNTTQKLFTLIILPSTVGTLALNNPGLGAISLTQGLLASYPLSASGGVPPYTFTLTAGSLPPGISLEGPGETIGDLQPGFAYLAGRAMVPGTYNFTLKVADNASHTATQAYTVKTSIMTIGYPNLPISGNPLVLFTPYSQPMLVVGGNGNYTSWTTSGAIYPGLSVSPSTGLITGAPTVSTSQGTIWTVTDSVGNTLSNNVFIGSASTATAPTIGKAFNPTSIAPGGTSVVTLTLSNSNVTGLSGGSFTDTLTNMSAAGGAVTGTCAGTTPASLTAGATALSFSGIAIPASSSCTVIFSVTSSTLGTQPNTTSGVTTTQTTSPGLVSNTANLTVGSTPTITKAFNPTSIITGGTSTVTLTLSNSNTTALTGGAFTDTLAGMSAAGGAVTGTCAGTTPASLTAGATALSFTGITIPASGSCTVIFSVTSSATGAHNNTTSGVTTTQTPTAGAASNTAILTVTSSPTMSLSATTLNFGVAGGVVTDPQFVTVSFSGGAAAAWTASSNQANVTVSPTLGVGLKTLQITAGAGPSATITVTAPSATNSPLAIHVNVATVTPGSPFGSFDTPSNGATGVSGSIAVTGWALDSIEVTGVNVMREPVAGEPASPALILVGGATFVAGARPDVQALYPTTPFNYQAGWGYLLLTNELPNNGGAAGPGNGTYKLHAIATNKSGVSVDLGTKTITVNNAAATLPFGAIDTPGQGATVSGTVTNFGWALTPPTTGCPAADQPCIIPVNGSTIFVYVDGVSLGNPVYNLARCDVDQLFPGYANSGSTNCALNGTSPGPVGYFNLDTTQLVNGVHTIAWSVTDNAGRAQGIGSRYFTVEN